MLKPQELLFKSTGDWLLRDISRFSISPFIGTSRIVELIKPIGEMALAVNIVSSFIDDFGENHGRQILDFIWKELAGGELIRELLCNRPDLIVLSSIYGTFKRQGYTSEGLEREIRKIVSTPGYFGLDMPAWRRLDLLNGLNEINLDKEFDLSECYLSTWLSQCHSPWTLTDATAYAVTHTVFYMTGYGANKDRLPKTARQYLQENIETWTKTYIEEGNFDIAAEMIMCRACIGMPAVEDKVSNKFIANQFADGAIPGPKYGALALLYGEENEERRYFLKNYHTTLVTFVAMAMTLGSRQ